MKITIFAAVLCVFLLGGCASQAVFETLGNVLQQPANTLARELHLDLPQEAAVSVVAGDAGALYLCDGYEIMVETLAAGDLNETLLTLTGFSRDALTVIQTQHGDLQRYECAWSSAGEGGDQVARTVILDDGYYHYCVTFCASSEDSGSLQSQWQAVIDSISVS